MLFTMQSPVRELHNSVGKFGRPKSLSRNQNPSNLLTVVHKTVTTRIEMIYFIEVRVQLSIGQQECVGTKILNPVCNPEIGIFEEGPIDRSFV